MLENRTAFAADATAARARNAEPARQLRAKRTNDPFAEISTNTARGRRVADLVRAYLRALGNPANIEQQAAVIAAAELQVLAEEARGAALNEAGPTDLDQVIRVQGAADRAVRRLGIKFSNAPASGPTLAEYLESRATALSKEATPDESAAGSAADETLITEFPNVTGSPEDAEAAV